MKLPKNYSPNTTEPVIMEYWENQGIYHFDRNDDTSPVYSIDTPPPTVSGKLHLGHVYSYTHADIIARFHRMRGANVFYPMGFDDNGLPTERLVEREDKVTARTIGRESFISRCMEISKQAEETYRNLWKRLGLSVDWHYSYRTINPESQRVAQLTFIDMYEHDLVYQKQAPAIWCPLCETAIAQADLNDLTRDSLMHTIKFFAKDGTSLQIATTRPELLPACVAVFIHPGDERYASWVDTEIQVPLFGQWVPVLEDAAADPDKGTGAVMCCTFGDVTDVSWWYDYNLPLRPAIDKRGSLLPIAGKFAALPAHMARAKIVQELKMEGLLDASQQITQSIRVHERCDTPVEYIVTRQWFVSVMPHKLALKDMAQQVAWYPPHMEGRMLEWIEGLRWDWCISRQRSFGVPFPVWTCKDCGDVRLADVNALPVDPTQQLPTEPCACGCVEFIPEGDVMDTWMTSSLSPQIVGQRENDPALYQKVYPFSLRPQAHEIIRTWAFYTLVQSLHQDGIPPWRNAGISGWGLAPQGHSKISKSRESAMISPLAMIDKYSADAVRYWASSTGFGKDAVISEEKIKAGAKLVTKLYNVARFCAPFLPQTEQPMVLPAGELSAADQWILFKLDKTVRVVTNYLQEYDYAAATHEVEVFFWHDLADNYLEMVKLRMYEDDVAVRLAPTHTVDFVLFSVLKLLAPYLPFITESLYQKLYRERCGIPSIHKSPWPQPIRQVSEIQDAVWGDHLVNVASLVRRYKSENNISLGQKLTRISIESGDAVLLDYLRSAECDLMSITRAQKIEFHLQENGEYPEHERFSISVVE